MYKAGIFHIGDRTGVENSVPVSQNFTAQLQFQLMYCIMCNAGTVQHAETTHLQAISMDFTGTPCFHHKGSAAIMLPLDVPLLLVPCLSDESQSGNLLLAEHKCRPCLMCPRSRMDLRGMGSQGKFELKRKEEGQREIAPIAIDLMGPSTILSTVSLARNWMCFPSNADSPPQTPFANDCCTVKKRFR